MTRGNRRACSRSPLFCGHVVIDIINIMRSFRGGRSTHGMLHKAQTQAPRSDHPAQADRPRLGPRMSVCRTSIARALESNVTRLVQRACRARSALATPRLREAPFRSSGSRAHARKTGDRTSLKPPYRDRDRAKPRQRRPEGGLPRAPISAGFDGDWRRPWPASVSMQAFEKREDRVPIRLAQFRVDRFGEGDAPRKLLSRGARAEGEVAKLFR